MNINTQFVTYYNNINLKLNNGNVNKSNECLIIEYLKVLFKSAGLFQNIRQLRPADAFRVEMIKCDFTDSWFKKYLYGIEN